MSIVSTSVRKGLDEEKNRMFDTVLGDKEPSQYSLLMVTCMKAVQLFYPMDSKMSVSMLS